MVLKGKWGRECRHSSRGCFRDWGSDYKVFYQELSRDSFWTQFEDRDAYVGLHQDPLPEVSKGLGPGLNVKPPNDPAPSIF